MTRVCAISLILSLISLVASNLFVLSASNTGTDEINAALSAINEIRTKRGLHVLVHEESASLAAALHAEELAGRELLSHRSLNGERVAERYRLAGGTGTRAGENLGAGDSIESILIAWMRSPSHRSNLLNPEWYSAGLGQARTDGGRIVLVASFSNSRWKDSALEVNGGIATLSGRLVRSEAMAPPLISMRVGGNEIGPLLAEQGAATRMRFNFPVPQSWREGGMIPILLSVMESGVEKHVDLLLLEVP